jgi:RNA polymerase sigma-70 factor (family 1)
MAVDDVHTDQELTALLKSGDHAAFALIYDRYAPHLVRFAATKLFDLDDCRDLVQDIFVNLWMKKDIETTITGDLKSYLFAVTRHKIIDKIRKNVTREEYAIVIQSLKSYDSYDPEKDIDAKEMKTVVELAIQKLPPRTKEIYMLSRNEHLSIAEIAKKLSLSDQTVKNQLSTAIKSLKETISKLAVILL